MKKIDSSFIGDSRERQLVELFDKFKYKLSNGEYEINVKDKLLTLFQRGYENIQYIKSYGDNESDYINKLRLNEPLESLANLSSACRYDETLNEIFKLL